MADKEVSEDYKEGWNAYIDNKEFDVDASSEWRAAWLACTDAYPGQRTKL